MTTEALWQKYHADREDDATRNELFRRYLSLAEQQAHSLARGRSAVDREDILAEGRLALLRAIQDWDPAKGSDPEAFLRFKTRAGIVDAMRVNGWARKGVRAEGKRLAEAEESLIVQNGGLRPSESEVAEHLGLDIDELAALRSKVIGTSWTLESLDAPAPGFELGSWHESVADADQLGPEGELIATEQKRQLREVLTRLSPIHRELLTRRFLRGEQSKTIARDLRVHESRVAQLFKEALDSARELSHRRVLAR